MIETLIDVSPVYLGGIGEKIAALNRTRNCGIDNLQLETLGRFSQILHMQGETGKERNLIALAQVSLFSECEQLGVGRIAEAILEDRRRMVDGLRSH